MKKDPTSMRSTITQRSKSKIGLGVSAIAVSALCATQAFADIVYVSSSPLGGCTVTANCPGANADGTYTEFSINVGDFGARGTAAGRPSLRPAPRGYISSTSLTSTNSGVDLTPTLGVAGGVYQIDYNFSSTAGNTSTNVIMSVSSTNATLSFSQTDKLQRQFGNPANQWQFMGYVTNTPGSTTPRISFRYQSGEVNGGSQNRLIIDTWRFTLVQPCLAVPVVSVTGPLSTNSNQVVVSGVASNATTVTVYQDTGSGMVQIGTKTTGVTAGNNTVTVSGLTPLAQVAATQTIGGQEGCAPTSGTLVGKGANPSVRVALSIRETSSTGPIGAAGNTSSGNIHFLGASVVSGTAPVDAHVFYPSNTWQTLTFQSGNETIGDSANAVGAFANGPGYNAFENASIQVFAFKTVNNVKIYSLNPATSDFVSSNDVFTIHWTWDAVPGADGYRVTRAYNFSGYNDYVDVTTNSYTDSNTGWIVPAELPVVVTPNSTPKLSPSIQWNPTVGNSNNIATPWGIIESINFSIDASDNTGPFDLYIDNLQNGATVFQTFEDAVAGTQDYVFRAPSFSGTTSANILSEPNLAAVSNFAADTGSKSLRVRFQWSGTNSSRWLRLTTSGANPMVNLADPISFRMLLLPVGATPVPPPRPTLSADHSTGNTVITWSGVHNLQAAPAVTGTYTNVPGVTNSPYIDTTGESTRFFRLVN